MPDKEEYYHIDNCTGLLGNQDIKVRLVFSFYSVSQSPTDFPTVF